MIPFTTDYERTAGMPMCALVSVSMGAWGRGMKHLVGRLRAACVPAMTGTGQLSQRLGRSLT